MSKKRYIDTRFWSDTWVMDDLSKHERLLFLYLLTNDKTNLAGVYEISLKTIMLETDFSKEELLEMLPRLRSRVVYEHGWIALRKAVKHQNYTNSKIEVGIINALSKCPHELLRYIELPKDAKVIKDYISVHLTVQTTLPLDESSMSLDEPSHFDSDSNLDSDLDIDSNLDASAMAAEPPAKNDEVSKLYYQVMKQYSLPARNHNNVHAAIAKMKREATEPALIKYLKFLLEKYQHIEFKHKPDLSEALDIYAKRMQILNALKREFKTSTSGVVTI